MNTLYQKLTEDIKNAMRSKSAEKLSTLRMLKSALVNRLVKDGLPPTSDISDELFQKVVMQEIKQRKETGEQFKSAGREDLYEKTINEIEILSNYAPEPASEEEIKNFALEFINKNPDANMGAVMGATMKHFGSRADGNTVRQIVQELI